MKRYWPVLLFSLLAAVVYADTAPVSLQSILKAAPKANPIGSDTHLTAMKGNTLVYVNATSVKPPLATTSTAGIVKVGTGLAMDAEGKLNNTGIAGVASFKGRGGAVVPTTGDYTASMITGLSTVGISGSYTDLINQPAIPAAQVPSDWTASTGVARILNKPTVPTALSQLTQDATHRTVTDAEKATWNTSSASVNSVNGQTGTVTLTATDVGADPLGSATSVQTNLNAHTGATNNPHSVTKAQVGLGNVDNTSDANKPVSTATQAALDTKEPSLGNPSLTGYVLSSTSTGVRSWVPQTAGGGQQLNFAAGDNMTITGDDATKTLTFSADIISSGSTVDVRKWGQPVAGVIHQSQLQTAINYAASNHLRLILPSATYLIDGTTPITFPSNTDVSIQFLHGSVLKLVDGSAITAGMMINATGAKSVTIDGMEIDGNRINNTTSEIEGIRGFYATNTRNITLTNFYIHDTRCTAISLTDCPNYRIAHFKVINCGRSGTEMTTARGNRIGINLDSTSTEGDPYFDTGSVIEDGMVTGSGLDGVLVATSNTVVKDVVANSNGAEFALHNPGAAGLYMRVGSNAGAVTKNILVNHVTAAYNTGHGIDSGGNEVSNDGRYFGNLTIVNSISHDNYLHGIAVCGQDVYIGGNTSYNNGTLTTLFGGGGANSRRSGIAVVTQGTSTTSHVVVAGNHLYGNKYGINIEDLNPAGDFIKNITLLSNDIHDNSSGQINNSAGVFLATQVGIVPETATAGDLVVDDVAKIVYLGRQSTVPGDSSKFIVRDRLNRVALTVDPANSGRIDMTSSIVDITGNLGIGNAYFPTNTTNTINLFNGTPPNGPVTGGTYLYSSNSAGSGSMGLTVLDETNITTKVGTHFTQKGGTAPALTSCGTSPTIATGSNDHAGYFTIGSGGTGCTVTFWKAYTNKPSCVVHSETASAMTSFSPASTAITVAGSPGTYHYLCTGLNE